MQTPPPRLQVTNLTRAFGGRRVVNDVSIDIAAGQVTCLLGPSGCGKSTTLRMIAGVENLDSGTVTIDGAVMADGARNLPPEARSVGLMFQDFALFPHLTVAQNVAFGLKGGTAEKTRRVDSLLEKVTLTGFGAMHPHQLSGGEQQRVALARSFINRPKLLFADEPTGNLDGDTAALVASLLFDLNRTAGTALVLVTHDLELASRCGRILRLRGGRQV